MLRRTAAASLVAAALAGAVAAGATGTAQSAAPAQAPPGEQYPIFNAEQLDDSMKIVGLAFGLANTSIGKGDFPLAKDYLARARDQLATTITFWRKRKDDQAVTLLRTTLQQLDALDAAVSAEQVDAAAAAAIAKSAGASCQACHTKYREQDPASKAYRLRSDLR
jgi:hypothetical protein